MIKKYNEFIIEEKIYQLIYLIESINEDNSKDPEVEKNIDGVLGSILNKEDNSKKTLLNKLWDKLIKHKKYAAFLIGLLVFTHGQSIQDVLGLGRNSDEKEFIKGAFRELTDEERIRAWGTDPEDMEIIGQVEKEKITPPNPETQKHIERFKKKGYNVIDPSDMKIGEKFNPKKTIFTSGKFPYKISYNCTKGVFFKYENQRDLIGKYIPEFDKIAVDEKLGLKLLALSMTYMEGYIKKDSKGNKSVSYQTNNPGNIGNTDDKKRNYRKTLGDGINLQINYIKDVAYNKKESYPIGKVKYEIPYYSGELLKVVPGFIFVYEGTLEQFLKIYATGPRDGNNYLNVVLTFFNTYMPDQKITPETKIKDIINLGGNERLIDVILERNPEVVDSMIKEMLLNKFSVDYISEYIGVSKEKVKEIKNRRR